LEQPESQHVGVGGDAMITAVFKGDAPATEVTWQSRKTSTDTFTGKNIILLL